MPPAAHTPEREAAVLGRYLAGCAPAAEVPARYRAAIGALCPAEAPDAALAFAVRRPWSLPLLDAASGLRRPTGALRRRLLVMAAILETHPAHAEAYIPRAVHPLRLVALLAWEGVAAAVKAAAGVPLLAGVEWRR